MSSNCLYEQARRTLGLTDGEWAALLREQGGVASADELYAPRPEVVRAGRQVLDCLLARGFRSSHVLMLSADYLLAVFRLGRERGLSDVEMRALAAGFGHNPAWHLWMIDGRVFQALVGYFQGLGCEMPELRRSWMTDERVALLDRLCRSRGLGEAAFAVLLRDMGGGVFRVQDLDEEGFDRIVVALEAHGEAGRA